MAITQFGQFGLDDRLLEALEKHGLIEPTYSGKGDIAIDGWQRRAGHRPNWHR